MVYTVSALSGLAAMRMPGRRGGERPDAELGWLEGTLVRELGRDGAGATRRSPPMHATPRRSRR